MKPQSRRLAGLLLFCLGAWVLYASLSALHGYFGTGSISWGYSVRKATGERALILHGLAVLAGAVMAAKGMQYLIPVGGSPE